ncbi:Uncharacterized conserved protein, DUF885 familyt [Chitinophaga terrae (ex Kim and Jung 2007)]|uniref:Uncharacterized conserved protein, DUF885 familyt n=1 Tax=Chitinophaga terrae (ex Kim and Jung 2007) TaxID=408074 RepID=A0A1H3X398_9BACT|nr:DUF885 domain-containing protein [Chitinophaga terrae (ex Kim and Jung 2007)]GEP90193.1 hypothetical protein CTE07_18380 [Chitinophaga terrae (ex Kim and Jung 2007)]SDZ92988.1 Uncharacterized conserved protein, DUF885 familyt [Chitinophaga terrae (ex Kim and Jung 2007)]
MKRIFLCAIAAAAVACNNGNGNARQGAADSILNLAFSNYEQAFIADLWKENPDWATNVGYHNYDTVLIVPDSLSRQADLQFVARHLDSLKAYPLDKLTDANKIDHQLISNYLQSVQWSVNTEKSYQWNPSSYNISGTFAFILNENYAPLETRLRSFAARLKNVPAYYAAAKSQVVNPVPELTALAIDQNMGGLSVFQKDFADSLKKTTIPAVEQAEMIAASKAAVQAVTNYANWLKALKPENPRSFRLGKALYDAKFNYEIQSSYPAEQIYDSAIARKAFVHGEMAKISRSLWPKYFGNTAMPADSLELIGKMIDTLSANHVKPEEFQSAIEKQLPALISFIKEKDLLYIDPSKPLVVRKEPAYMAGVAGASISAPGPYDKGGNTYYNVGSLEGWPKDKAESYLREYNHYILQILDIHEAIPGHYTQLVYSNQSPSLIKSILGNGAMVEGWAVYTEQMMLENGYGNNEPEMWLMWYKWNLRTVCNTILDYSVHVKNMSKEDAIHLLTKEAFQQAAEAEGKWKRVSVTSVQLTSYFTGYKEIIDLREAYKKQEGEKYRLKAFNEKFLSYGSAPVKYIRELMLSH